MKAIQGVSWKWVCFLVVVAGGTVGGASRVNEDFRNRLEKAQSLLAGTEAQITEARSERDRIIRQGESAHQEMLALRAVAAAADRGQDSSDKTGIKPWLARVKQLKQLFAQRAEQQIPELQFLTDLDWLLIAKTAELDTDDHIRASLARARKDAKWIFARRLVDALSKYKKATQGELPPTTVALAPYFHPAVDEGVFKRYEIVRTGKALPGQAGTFTAIREKVPIDSDYDSRISIQANGGLSNGSSLDWLEGFRERSLQAHQSYARDNNGASPPNMLSLLPYFTPTLDAATRQKVLRLEKMEK